MGTGEEQLLAALDFPTPEATCSKCKECAAAWSMRCKTEGCSTGFLLCHHCSAVVAQYLKTAPVLQCGGCGLIVASPGEGLVVAPVAP